MTELEWKMIWITRNAFRNDKCWTKQGNRTYIVREEKMFLKSTIGNKCNRSVEAQSAKRKVVSNMKNREQRDQTRKVVGLLYNSSVNQLTPKVLVNYTALLMWINFWAKMIWLWFVQNVIRPFFIQNDPFLWDHLDRYISGKPLEELPVLFCRRWEFIRTNLAQQNSKIRTSSV